MKPIKEILDKFYQNLHPESSDADFERFILRLRREVMYSLAWEIQALGDKIVKTGDIKELILKKARENVLKDK